MKKFGCYNYLLYLCVSKKERQKLSIANISN
jgi:hypothetical protein